jgi:DDE superfamily endonuclease
MEKKLPQALAAMLKRREVRGRRVRLMFQDEARFGRMVRIRRCWAPKPARPMVCNGYEREFVYVYGAVSPIQGQLDWMLTRQMNTTNMSSFLAQVSAKHRRDFIVMVVDGASSHVCKDLMVPENIRLLRLPPIFRALSASLKQACRAWPQIAKRYAA